MDLYKKFLELYKKINKKNLILICLCIVLVGILIIYNMGSDIDENPNSNVINSGQVAKAVSLLFHSMDEIKENKTDLFSNEEEQWYEKYMNMMYSDTYFNVKDIRAVENEVLQAFTYADLEKLYTNIGIVDKELMSYVKNNKAGSPIRVDVWSEIYTLMVKKLDIEEKIKTVNLIVAGTVSKDPSLPQWMAATTYGRLGFEGLSVDYYIDKGITVHIKDKQIVNVVEEYSENITYNNCWVIAMSGGNIKAYVEGCIREFITTDKTSNYSNVVADITIEKGKLTGTKFKTDTVSGKVLASSNKEVEIEALGSYDMDENCRVYKIYGNIQMCSVSEVLVGYDAQQFILNDDGKICAIVIDRDVQASNIRVLIKNTGFKEMLHEYITVVSETGCIVTCGNSGNVFEIEPGEEYTFSPDSDVTKLGRIKITSKGLEGKIGITSIKRGYGAPYYRGDIEIVQRDGKLLLINELPLEEYLYSVVPSEMPWSYNYEALKAQAICARSFAYLHILNNRYSEYGAHVDDSTSYQVYNNSEEQTVTNSAVDETYGKVLMHGNDVISAYFFSTSCGSTTTAAVWGSKLPYIENKLLTKEQTGMNLMDEPVFDAFIRTNYSTYDSEYPWYRWKVTMTLEQLGKTINSQIGTIGAENVQVLGEKGQWINKKISSVGLVKKIELGEREPGGVLKYITVFGTDCTVKIFKEYNIRKVISPDGIALKRGTGDEVTTMTMLPSGYFVLDQVTENNLLSAYTFVGGGYGHGVGMSQNGANTMAKLGMNCEEILKFFYKDVAVGKKY